VEEGVVEVVVGAVVFEGGDGVVEGEPLGDAKGEFVLALHLFEDEEVVPVGEVLYGGDSVGEGVVDGELEGAATGGGVGFGDDGFDEVEGGLFADDAGGLAGGVEVDLRSGGGFGAGGDVSGGESGGVDDGDVAVGALEVGGVVAGNGVEVLSGG